MRTALIMGVAISGAVALAPQVRAQDLGRILHAIIEPDEAHRYEQRAHDNGRLDEERYWQRYGAGLREQRAHQNGQLEQERYWHRYGEGLR